MRVLVTGGAGFIGSTFVEHALAADPDVRVTTYDALTYAGSLENLASVADDPRHTFVRGDVRELDALLAAAAGHDAIAHFAAESHVDRSIDGQAVFLSTNVLGTGTVLEVARRLEVGRTLLVSTDEVYGSVTEGHSDEGDRLEPSSPYSASKASAELLAVAWRATWDTPVVITRAANNYGPRQFPEKMVPRAITNVLRGLPVPVYGDGQQVRDWLHVADNADAQWRVLLRGVPGEAYNVGTGSDVTNLQLVDRLLAALGVAPSDRGVHVTHVTDRAGHDRRYAVNARRVRELGWAPATSLEDGLASTVAWFRANEPWWRSRLHQG